MRNFITIFTFVLVTALLFVSSVQGSCIKDTYGQNRYLSSIWNGRRDCYPFVCSTRGIDHCSTWRRLSYAQSSMPTSMSYGTSSYGSPYGSSPYGASPYGSSPYGASSYGSSPYGSSSYGSPYGSSGYGSSPYGSSGYGASSYGGYGSYGSSPTVSVGSNPYAGTASVSVRM